MPTPGKIDLFKSLKSEYASPRTPKLVPTTPGLYLAFNGSGRPGGDRFGDGIGALYAVGYTLKFRRKLGPGPDYAVGKLECIWKHLPAERDSDGWRWQLLMRVPDFITAAELDETIAVLIEKKKPATVREVQRVEIDEGLVVQMLHVGPYEDEPSTFAAMARYATAEGYASDGDPHEIYLSDPRRVEPARLKTILRQPVSKTA
ncbi:GyrI-like domain-containing protein [Synoicihabitans lomoniglobus]|uniref:GyrI-like domain-containing protein n=1 Tax=Synoicihabitans lomoniglobus TaxID=2909285 RepID=A0AAF0I3V5_9BACT|nr:GyrI-like domain-containing protein [Opitutaceae bacterium LMO-M01]WED66508.1 GyrI-like domain-containing protein [Opitutaceae bacterium LMO-M01]